MTTIPVSAVPIGAYVQYVTTVDGRIDTDEYGPVVDAYRPYQYPALTRLRFANGATVQAFDHFDACVYGL